MAKMYDSLHELSNLSVAQERTIDALRAENQRFREAAEEALHYLECHADIDAQLFCTRRLRAALAQNPIAHEQGDK